jgi:hypothetical protein
MKDMSIKTLPTRHILLFLLGVLVLSADSVKASSIFFVLDSPIFVGAPGDTIPITGTLENNDLSTVFLNNASGILGSLDLDLDYTDFFSIVPASMGAGESYSGPIFAVLIGPQATPGDYFASFTVQGGIDANAFDDLATQNFQITVTGTSGVPEPSTFGLVLSVTLMLAASGIVRGVRRRRMRNRLSGWQTSAIPV